jgi:hypothetical protein
MNSIMPSLALNAPAWSVFAVQNDERSGFYFCEAPGGREGHVWFAGVGPFVYRDRDCRKTRIRGIQSAGGRNTGM